MYLQSLEVTAACLKTGVKPRAREESMVVVGWKMSGKAGREAEEVAETRAHDSTSAPTPG